MAWVVDRHSIPRIYTSITFCDKCVCCFHEFGFLKRRTCCCEWYLLIKVLTFWWIWLKRKKFWRNLKKNDNTYSTSHIFKTNQHTVLTQNEIDMRIRNRIRVTTVNESKTSLATLLLLRLLNSYQILCFRLIIIIIFYYLSL